MPKVSVIIPNYNHAAYLPQRIESVLAQYFDDYELLIMDDASTDHSREVIEKYVSQHPKIKTLFNTKNSGSPFAQWNKGAKMARGKYLWLAESDDFCEPGFLEKLVPLLDKNPQVGIAYSQTYLVDEQGEILNSYLENFKFLYKTDAWEKDFIKPGAEVCRDWLVFHNPIPNASGALLRKSVYEKVGMADPGMKLNGDWCLYAKMLAQSDLAFTTDHLNYFRVHPHTQRERARATPLVYDEMVRINQFIRKEVPQSTANADAALAKIANWWKGSLYYQKWNWRNFRDDVRLFHFFKKYKNGLFFTTLYALSVEGTRGALLKTGLLKPAKKLRHKLFPGKYFEY